MSSLHTYRPYLQPTSGLNQAARTNGSLLISSPRNRIGSQGRIYAFLNPKVKDNNILIS